MFQNPLSVTDVARCRSRRMSVNVSGKISGNVFGKVSEKVIEKVSGKESKTDTYFYIRLTMVW